MAEPSSLEAHTGENSYLQYAFDNADFNVKTLTGHGTFHSMGGVRFTTPAPHTPANSVPRVLHPPNISEISARGSMPITWYKKPLIPGLKAVKARDFKTVPLKTREIVEAASILDNLCVIAPWAGTSCPPAWNGFMRKVYNTGFVHCNKTDIDALPFINLDPGNLSTIYTALLFAENECKKQGQRSCLVTFDQPLYAKASEIVAAAPPGELDIVTVRLGGFHLLMSFLGSVGFIMAGSGLEQLWEQVYAKASVHHLVSGHAYSRSLRAHFLTERALFSLILSECADLEEIRDELQQLVNDALEGTKSPLSLVESNILQHVHNFISQKQKSIENSGPTAKLWIQYLRMVKLIRLFLRAERTANWELHLYCVAEMIPYLHAAGHFQYAKYAHLYLQQMEELDSKMPPEEFSKLVSDGHYTIRRTSEFWSCISTDMAIEQSLMRLLKVQGGLTHGRGISDSQLAYFVLSFPGCLKICSSLERLTGINRTSTEQHVELRDSRRSVDAKHLNSFINWLSTRSPWQECSALRSLSSGIVGDPTINCHNAKELGNHAMKAVIGCTFSDMKLSRKNKVLPLAAVNSKVIIRNEVVPVNSQQLFVRIAWAINNSSGNLSEYLKYELSPRPPALFDEVSMRKTTKSTLLKVFCFSSDYTNFSSSVVVIDGGYLLRALVWPKPATFGALLESYKNYVGQHFCTHLKNVVVVFDGYGRFASTKAEEQRRRASRHSSTDIVFDSNTTVSVSQADFLANGKNKSRLISLLTNTFLAEGLEVRHAAADADTMIVDTALEKVNNGQEVTVVATDTDIIVMLLNRTGNDRNIQVVSPVGSENKIYNIKEIQDQIGSKKDYLMFVHAITGCDTTSSLFGIGKKKAFKLLEKREMQDCAAVFNNPSALKSDIVIAGEKFVMKLYSSETYSSLDQLRSRIYARTLARKAVTSSFELATLPPTSAACEQHSLRTYFQVGDFFYKNWGVMYLIIQNMF